MHSSPQPVPTGARHRGTRRRDNCPAYVLPHVRELPLRLEPVAADGFGGLVALPPRLLWRVDHQPAERSPLMTFISTRRTAAAIAAAVVHGDPGGGPGRLDALPSTFTTDAAQSAQVAADRRRQGDRPTLAEPPRRQPGRTPRHDRGAKPAPTTIEVVRPERTIVRDVDEALPIALSGAALLLVLAALAGMLVRGRLAVPRPGRSN